MPPSIRRLRRLVVASPHVVAALAHAGCGGSQPPPGAADAHEAHATVAPAAEADGAPASDDHACVASVSTARPEGWVDVGTVLLTIEAGQPRSAEVRDAAGRVLAVDKVAPTSAADLRKSLQACACRLGGMLAVLDKRDAPPVDGSLVVTVVRPEKEDEGADLAALCAEPEGGAGGLARDRAIVFALDRHDERLTSRRFRAWLRSLTDGVAAASGGARLALVSQKADELDVAARARGLPSCWLAAAIRK